MEEENRVLTDAARMLESAARKIRIAVNTSPDSERPDRPMARKIRIDNLNEAKTLIVAAEARLG
jgi:hypothetical protein